MAGILQGIGNRLQKDGRKIVPFLRRLAEAAQGKLHCRQKRQLGKAEQEIGLVSAEPDFAGLAAAVAAGSAAAARAGVLLALHRSFLLSTADSMPEKQQGYP